MAEDRQTVTANDPTVITVDLRRALAAVAGALKLGARTHRPDDWKTHDAAYHADRGVVHIDRWLAGDDSEDHLALAATRLLLALQLDQEQGEQ